MSIENNCTFIGNLCADPELKIIKGGERETSILDGTVAINRFYKNKEGQKVEDTDFIPFTAFGKAAELIQKHVKKGERLGLQGEIRQEKWEDKDTGANRSMLKLRVENFLFLAPKN
jgi:single-strand DNA-binding protein